MAKRSQKIEAADRSMDPVQGGRSRVFFFPKRNPPASVRAGSLEEAEQRLAAPNE
jgi:hypothetical protein